MAERQKKGGSKKKDKGSIEAPRQKTLFDMFPTKVAKGPPTVITLESSPETPDVETEPQPSSTAVVPVDGRRGGISADPNENILPDIDSSLDSASISPQLSPLETPSNPSAANQNPLAAAPILSEKVEGMTPSKPIVIDIDSSPIKLPAYRPKAGAIHPFFVTRGNTTKQKAPQNPSNSKVGWAVPYPDHISQHVRGPQTLVTASSSNKSSRITRVTQKSEKSENLGYSFLKAGLDSPLIPSNGSNKVVSQSEEFPSLRQYASTIPTEHLARHSSISRLVNRSLSGTLPQSPEGRTLAEKWRPRCAEEVLGNEASALFLRNWLRALELQLETAAPPARPPATSQRRNRDNRAVPNRTRKRPRVITEVVRPRYRKRAKTESEDEDDWIVNDEDEDEDNAYSSSYYASDYEPGLPSSPIPSTSSIPDTGSEVTTPNPPEDIPQDLGELHNTILLVGPPGSGKTASVYACAEELGWEVFEVYPGIGKRSGSSVENLVGEVGKNHLVRQRPHGRHDFFTSFGSPSKPKRKQGFNDLPKSEWFERDESGASLTEYSIQDSAADQAPSFVQSLILLEEVDILFKEDVRFWETVINVIRECKRPIICTCNDISLIPLADLPIQRVLEFGACPSNILTSYLQGICCAEGRSVERRLLSSAIVSREGHDGSTQHAVDIRRAINWLDLSLSTGFSQLSTETLPPGPTLSSEPLCRSQRDDKSGPSLPRETLCILAQCKKSAYDADAMSFLDSELCFNTLDRLLTIEIESLGPTNDDEVGHPILYDTRQGAFLASTYGRDVEMRAIIDRVAPRPGPSYSEEERALTSAREKLRAQYGCVLRETCLPRVWATAQPNIFTEYGPFIRQVAEAEEAQAAALVQRAQELGGRRTRNSALSEHYRALNLSELGREGVAAICFQDL